MSADLEFTGERYIPGTAGEIAHEHWHRYAFARGLVGGRHALDVACGEGYGSALLAESAARVTGVDIDATTLEHARLAYARRDNVEFVEGSAAALPIGDGTVDVVVSFETIEHLAAADQPAMIGEFARVLRRDGIVVLSSPNRPQYSDARDYANPFHVHELDRAELARLVDPHFPAQRWYRQHRYLGSALWCEDGSGAFDACVGDASSATAAPLPEAMYFVVIAARTADALPVSYPSLSLFTDGDDAELKRVDHEIREAMRLDGLLRIRDAELRDQVRHSNELQAMVVHRDHVIAEHAATEAALCGELENGRQVLAAVNAENEQMQLQIDAQQRLIVYRASVRWWLWLPLVRVKRLWDRIRPA
ncbi:MAG: class I SAM-dependent methyltransferase [Betaproteobacteria bacterium]